MSCVIKCLVLCNVCHLQQRGTGEHKQFSELLQQLKRDKTVWAAKQNIIGKHLRNWKKVRWNTTGINLVKTQMQCTSAPWDGGAATHSSAHVNHCKAMVSFFFFLRHYGADVNSFLMFCLLKSKRRSYMNINLFPYINSRENIAASGSRTIDRWQRNASYYYYYMFYKNIHNKIQEKEWTQVFQSTSIV